MDYSGIRVSQKVNYEFIQEIDQSWYYLEENTTYSRGFNTYDEAKDGLLKYYETKEDKHE